jgi:hypothetical protein
MPATSVIELLSMDDSPSVLSSLMYPRRLYYTMGERKGQVASAELPKREMEVIIFLVYERRSYD